MKMMRDSLRRKVSIVLVLAIILTPLGSTVFAAPKGNPGDPFLENISQPPGRANAPLTQEKSNVKDRETNTKPAKALDLPSAAANKKDANLPGENVKPLKVTNEPSDEFLVRFRPGTPSEEKRSINANNKVQEKDFIPGIHVHVLATPPGKSANEMIQVYRKNPNVVFAELNYVATAQVLPNDTYYPSQRGLHNIDPQGAWEITQGCASAPIAVLDTGIDYNHLDLAGRVIAGYDFINNREDAIDDRGHGTQVAGIIGAATNNGLGMAAVTWQNPLMPVKVLNSSGSGTYSGVAQGIIFAADNGAKVINMSLGGSSPSSTLESALQYAYDKGIILVAAAGNSSGSVMYPAAYPTVIAVGAVDDSDVLASFSCYGPEVSVVAPGVLVWSTRMGGSLDDYTRGSGTSFAAPFVAGLAGLILSIDPSLSPAEVGAIIQQGAEDLGEAGWDPYYGWGRINMTNTLALLGQQPPPKDLTPPAVEILSPADGTIVEEEMVVVEVAASDDNSGIAKVELLIDGAATFTKNTAPFHFTWNMTELPEGTFVLTAAAWDNAGNQALSAPISVERTIPAAIFYEITTSINPADAGLTTGDGLFEEGEKVTISVNPDAAYNFINWTLNGQIVTNALTFTFIAKADQLYQANLALKTYTLSYLAAAGGSIGGNPVQTVKHGQDGQEVTAIPGENYVFIGWSDGTTAASRLDKNITGDLQFTAHFKYVEPEPAPAYKEATFSGGVGHRNQPQELSYNFDAIGGVMEINLTWSPPKSTLALYLYDQYGSLVAVSALTSGSSQYISTKVDMSKYKITVKSLNGQGNFTLVIKNTK